VLSKEKQRYIVYCDATLRKAELEAEAESITKIQAFQSLKKHKAIELDSLPDKALQIDDYENFMMDKVDMLEDELMEIEMLLQDALGEATLKFRDKIKDLNSEIQKKTVDFIASCVENCIMFHETLKQQAIID
jgi:hypothetical protein